MISYRKTDNSKTSAATSGVAEIGKWFMGVRQRGSSGVDHGSPKILVGWATMHLTPPIVGLKFVNPQEN